MNLLTGFGGFWLKLTIVAGVLYVQTILLTVCLRNRCILGSKQLEKLLVERVYPGLKLPRRARKIQVSRLLSNWSEEKQLRKGKQVVPTKLAISPEHEKQFEYYARTGQLVGDVDRKLPQDRWYQPEDWVRDIVAGEASEEMLCQEVKRYQPSSTAASRKSAPKKEESAPQKG